MGHAWIFSTPIVNRLMTFIAWYVLVGTEFGCGSTHDRRRNRSLKLQSDQPYLVFRMSSVSDNPFQHHTQPSWMIFSPFQKNLDLSDSLVKFLVQGLELCPSNHLHPRHVLRHHYWHHLRRYHPNHQHHTTTQMILHDTPSETTKAGTYFCPSR